MLRGSSSGVNGSVLSICKSARGMIWHCVVDYVPHPVCKLSKILISLWHALAGQPASELVTIAAAVYVSPPLKGE